VGGVEEEFQCPAGVRGRGDPTGAFSAEEAPRHARGFAEHLERKSTEHIFKRYPFFVDIFLLFFDKLIIV
jgi:hypothetical protein